MSALQGFEEFVEGVLEGGISRLFRSPLQPVEIERRLVRVLETKQTITAGRSYAPNHYRIGLHPDDFKVVAPQRHLWEREIAAFIIGLCQERGYTLVGRPVVLISPNAEVRRRRIAIGATLHDAPTEGLADPDAPPLQPTLAMPLPGPPPTVGPGPSPGPPPTLSLQMLGPAGPGVSLTFRQPSITIGRELDNDLVIEDSRVSRHHAQLLYQQDRYVLRDLGSTNGTCVNDRPTTIYPLTPGDRLSFGGVEALYNVA